MRPSLHRARLVYPNASHEPPGAVFDFWNYDPGTKGWHIYGLGRVATDGEQIVPNPGVTVYEFTGAMVAGPGLAPAIWAAVGNLLGLGDPVDPGTGLFIMQKTDLALPHASGGSDRQEVDDDRAVVAVFNIGCQRHGARLSLGSKDGNAQEMWPDRMCG